MAKKKKLKGYNGHALSCGCKDCAQSMAVEMRESWLKFGAAAEVDTDKTIFVRAYFRAQKNHLKKKPDMLRAVKAQLQTMLTMQRKAWAQQTKLQNHLHYRNRAA